MAYADQELSGNKIATFVVVALLHLALGYALVTGLAYEGFKQVMKKVTTVDIKKDEPKRLQTPEFLFFTLRVNPETLRTPDVRKARSRAISFV